MAYVTFIHLRPVVKNSSNGCCVAVMPGRKILAPGEEENLDVEEEEEDNATGAGSPESFPSRVPGTPSSFNDPGGVALAIQKSCVVQQTSSCCGC